MIRFGNKPLPVVAISLAGLLLNVMLLALPLAWRGALELIWRDPAVAAFLFLATAMVAAELTATPRRRQACLQPAAADRWPLRLAAGTGLCLLALFWSALLEHVDRSVSLPSLLAGGLLMAVGIALRYVAIRTLGRHFVSEVVVRPDQMLVRGGIYRLVRHPSEAGLLAMAWGACLLLGAPLTMAWGLAVLLPLVLIRITLEDRQLQLAFGRDFENYRRTKRLVPLVF